MEELRDELRSVHCQGKTLVLRKVRVFSPGIDSNQSPNDSKNLEKYEQHFHTM